jgi:hypothetical protein
MTVESHIGSTQVSCSLSFVLSDLLNEIAFEFSKRRFAQIYPDQLPIWTLFVSGASGGVRSLNSIIISTNPNTYCRSPIGSLAIL